jgi:ribosomal protein L30
MLKVKHARKDQHSLSRKKYAEFSEGIPGSPADVYFLVTMSYFRITLMRSGIGLPKRTQGVLKALGLRHRMKTVFYPVTPEVAGQIMKVKELISVREVEKPLTKEELREERKPDPGYYIETAMPRRQA